MKFNVLFYGPTKGGPDYIREAVTTQDTTRMENTGK